MSPTMSKLDDAYNKAMKAAGASKLPKEVHGLPADGDYVGTCQACFGQYVVKLSRGTESRAGAHLKPMPKGKLVVVLHGYQRPGTGYTEGECPGRGHEPFEVAKDVTQLFRDSTVKRLAQAQATLAEMKAGKVKSLFIEVPDKSKPRDPRTWAHPTKFIEIRPGWVNPEPEYYSTQTDNYERRLRIAIDGMETKVDHYKGDLAFLDRMLASWKYDPMALTKTAGRKIGVRAEDQAAAESKSRALSEQRNAARDEKEKKARAVLNAYLAHPQVMERAKSEPYMVRPNKQSFEMVPSGKTMFEYVSTQYIQRAEQEKNQVRRIELLKYANGIFRDIASGHFGHYRYTEIKVKLPRG